MKKDEFKIVKFKGGFGNQLFQYSFLRNLELVYGCEVKTDFSYYNYIKNDEIRIPRILKTKAKIDIANKDDLDKVLIFNNYKYNPKTKKYKILVFLESLLNKNYYFEINRKYRQIDNILNYRYFDGYWQSWRYLKGIEKEIKKEIVLKEKMTVKNMNFIKKINDEEAVFIGIRRGDYLHSKKALKHFGFFDENYFNKAIEIIKAEINNPIFFIFSNDIEWVKNNMKFQKSIEIYYREKKDQTSDLEELFVLSNFKHAIIVNSTFYWWGAWLINNPNKIVIAPSKWFADNSPIDIVPPEWIKL